MGSYIEDFGKHPAQPLKKSQKLDTRYIGDKPGTLLNAKLVNLGTGLSSTQRCYPCFGHSVRKGLILCPQMSPDDQMVCFSSNRVPLIVISMS